MPSPTPQPDQTTQMLDSSNLQGMPAAPAAPAAPAKPSLWKTLLMGVIGGLAGSGQKTFSAGVGSGARAEQGLIQQGVENKREDANAQSTQTFRNAEAANYTAEASIRQRQMDNADKDLRFRMEQADEKQVQFLQTQGVKPLAVFDNDADAAKAALDNARKVTPDGKIPSVVTFHYGNKILAYDMDSLGGANAMLQKVNEVGTLTGRGEITPQQWSSLGKAAQGKMSAEALQFYNPTLPAGAAGEAKINQYKNYLAAAEALPDSDPSKDQKVAALTNAVKNMQDAEKTEQGKKNKVVNGVEYKQDADGNWVALPKTTTTTVGGSGGAGASSAGSGGKAKGGLQAKSVTAPDGSPLTGKGAGEMYFGSMPDGTQVAGSLAELKAAGASGAIKTGAQDKSQIEASRQLIAPNGLFLAVAKDLDELDKKGMLGPAASRWNDFMSGKVGTGPEFAKLRTDMGLTSTRLMQAHVGLRGSKEMLEHFKSLADYRISDAQTLRAALAREFEYAKERAAMIQKQK